MDESQIAAPARGSVACAAARSLLFAAAAVVAALLEPLPPTLSGPCDGRRRRYATARQRPHPAHRSRCARARSDLHRCGRRDWPCGRESSRRLRELVGDSDGALRHRRTGSLRPLPRTLHGRRRRPRRGARRRRFRGRVAALIRSARRPWRGARSAASGRARSTPRDSGATRTATPLPASIFWAGSGAGSAERRKC